MKVAVTYEDGMVFQHFGHTQQFKLYEIEDGNIVTTALIDASSSGHGALAALLKDYGVQTLICGGIGAGARTALAEQGIALYPGAAGSADDCVQAWLAGSLNYDPNATCSHHHEGEHHCGENKNGCAGHCN